MARYRAKKNVIAQIRARGDKVHHYSARQIAELAEAELERNRASLFEEAKAVVEQWTAQGFFGKRAQRAFANVESDAQTQNAQQSIGSPVRMLGAE